MFQQMSMLKEFYRSYNDIFFSNVILPGTCGVTMIPRYGEKRA